MEVRHDSDPLDIYYCDRCGTDVVYGKCECSDFTAAKRRSSAARYEQYIAIESESLPDDVTLLCPLVHAGEVRVDGKRVPVFSALMERGVRLATHGGQSNEFRLWDSSDAGDENEGSAASDPDRAALHQEQVRES